MQSSTQCDEHGTDFLGNSLQLGTHANSSALQTALLQWCSSSRNSGPRPCQLEMEQVRMMRRRVKANAKTREELAQATPATHASTPARTVVETGHWVKDCWRPSGRAYDNNKNNINTTRARTIRKGKAKANSWTCRIPHRHRARLTLFGEIPTCNRKAGS